MGYKVEEELNEDAIITLSIQNKKSKDEHTHTNDLNNLFAVLENKKQEQEDGMDIIEDKDNIRSHLTKNPIFSIKLQVVIRETREAE